MIITTTMFDFQARRKAGKALGPDRTWDNLVLFYPISMYLSATYTFQRNELGMGRQKKL